MENNRGSALVGVLAVLFILLTIFFAIFALAISRNSLLQKQINHTRAAYLAEAGINQFLNKINSDSLGWKEIINYESNVEISAHEKYSILTSLLGGYILVNSTGIANGNRLTKRALIGLMPWKDLNAAIINGRADFPVVVAGQTEIIGDAIVGPESIIAGSIEGESFNRKELINGNIYPQTKAILPQINKDVIELYLDNVATKHQNPDRLISGSAVLSEITFDKKQDELTISVENNIELKSLQLNAKRKHVVIMAGGSIFINGSSQINGFIELIAGNSIIVGDSSSLNGTILVAQDSIIFKDQSSFMGQAISSSAIKVMNDANILYPSLFYSKSRETDTAGGIEFAAGSMSSVISLAEKCDNEEYATSNMIKIDTNATVKGIVFSERYSELSGTLYGVSITNCYWYSKPPTTYMNWLNNVTIDRSKLDFFPILPIMLPVRNGYGIFHIYEDNS
jgi:hypothetical protein